MFPELGYRACVADVTIEAGLLTIGWLLHCVLLWFSVWLLLAVKRRSTRDEHSIYIWRGGARNCRWGRTHRVRLPGSGNLPQYNLFMFHQSTCKCHGFIFFFSGLEFHCLLPVSVSVMTRAAVNVAESVSVERAVESCGHVHRGMLLLGHIVDVFSEESAYQFPQWLHQFAVPPAVNGDSLLPTSSPAFVSCFIDFSQYEWLGWDEISKLL